MLVKNPAHAGPATIHYTDIGDYLTREEKLAKVAEAGAVAGLEPVARITPNEHGDWLNQRARRLRDVHAARRQATSRASSRVYSGGLKTNRDAWVYNSSAAIA